MGPLHSGAATLPKGFRYHHGDYPEPRTPEPLAAMDDDFQPPSPPRPRFRLKRRNASHLAAPTQQFLASVAAADVPIPSIEEPELGQADEVMMENTYPVIPHLRDIEEIAARQKTRGRAFSPPRTPAPGAAPSLSPRRYPDWSIDSAFSSSESSPECESSRPSTARSTQTSGSVFSRFSLVSDDAKCVSPEIEALEILPPASSSEVTDNVVGVASKTRAQMRKAPWTRPMSQHLWSTYLMYLQDPRVTPFRTGKSCIPPHGVCVRVAREAKRSWKGSKANAKEGNKSGSSTPTADAPGAFIQWPHTCAATRAHLRELCRLKAASSAVRNHKYLSHSPTPFGRTATRHWNRRSTPLRSPSVFSGQDMALSLALSTADSMQPHGPLAQLTSSATDLTPEPPMSDDVPTSAVAEPAPVGLLSVEEPPTHLRRLGSPFSARSYGPSSSSSLAAGVSMAVSGPRRQTHTLAPRRNLQSPVRLTRSRSNTQKRRSRQQSHEPRKCKRPSLVSDMWTDPSTIEGNQGNSTRQSLEFSSTSSSGHDELFVPRTNVEELFSGPAVAQVSPAQPVGLEPAAGLPHAAPPRLGSPFSVSASSFSFPNRFSHPENLVFGAVRRPFATVQQPSEDANALTRPNLASRLTYINQRLREFRHRDQARRRSESPF